MSLCIFIIRDYFKLINTIQVRQFQRYSQEGLGGSIDPTIGLSAGGLQLGLTYHQDLGKLQNHVDYNTGNASKVIEPIMSINFGFVIGRFRTK